MKRIVAILMAIGLVLLAGHVQAANGVITLTYGHVERTDDPQHMFAEMFANRVKELTEGRVILEIYPNSQLGDAAELVDGVQFGSVDMAHHVFPSLAPIYDDVSVFGLPYLFRDGEHGLAVTNPETSPLMARFNEELVRRGNMRVLGSYTRGYRHLSTNFPVYRPEDLHGQRIRGIQLPMWMSMLRGMGAIPVPVAITEVPTALATGMIRGQENPLGTMWAAKLYETQTHIALTGHMLDLLPVFINNDSWNRISKEDQEKVMQAMREASEFSLRWSQEQEEYYIKLFEEQGVTVVREEDGLDVAAFREAVLAQVAQDFPAWQHYIEEIQAYGR